MYNEKKSNLIKKRLKNILKNDFLIASFKDKHHMTENLYRQLIILKYIGSYDESKELEEQFVAKGFVFKPEWNAEFDEEELEPEIEFFYNSAQKELQIDLDNVKTPKITPAPTSPQDQNPTTFEQSQDIQQPLNSTNIQEQLNNLYIFDSKPKIIPLWKKICAITLVLTLAATALMAGTTIIFVLVNKFSFNTPQNDAAQGKVWTKGVLEQGFSEWMWLFFKIGLIVLIINTMSSYFKKPKNENMKYSIDQVLMGSLLIFTLYFLVIGGMGISEWSKTKSVLNENLQNLNNKDLQTYFSIKTAESGVLIGCGAISLTLLLVTWYIKPKIDPYKFAEYQRLVQQKIMSDVENARYGMPINNNHSQPTEKEKEDKEKTDV